MPSLNFQKQFVALIESGAKRQTIRPVRKRTPIKVGDNLYLFTGLRTKNCKNIITPFSKPYNSRKTGKHSEYVICKSVEKIRIFRQYQMDMVYLASGARFFKSDLGYKFISDRKFLDFCKKDGFTNSKFFLDFFKEQYGLPFSGVIIKW